MPPKNVQLDVDEDVQEADCPHCTDSACETYKPIKNIILKNIILYFLIQKLL